MTRSRGLIVIALPVLLALGGAASAQPFGGGPGMMMDSGFRPGMSGRMCGYGANAFMVRRADRVALDLRLDDAQRAAFDGYVAAATKAAETMRAACPASAALTAPAQMAAMEARTGAMLAAIGTVRPALDAFYATLTDAQKARFDSRGGRWRFWHTREAW